MLSLRAWIPVLVGAASLTGAPSALAQWTPPVGLPAPAFGINQAAGAITHYVDNSRTCTGTGNGTAATPRCTVPTSLPAGSVVEVRGGPYTFSSDVSWTGNGTAAQPVFLRGVGSPVFRSSLRELDLRGAYFVVEGVVFDGINLGLGGNNLVLRSSELKNFSPSGNNAAVFGQGSNIVLYNNHIHNNGDPSGASENDLHGIKFASGSSSIWIVDNHIHDNGGDEVQIGDDISSEPWANNIFIGRNVGHGSRENCFDIKQARDVIISQNECYDYQPVSSSDGTAIVVHDGPERVWLLYNKIHDSAVGIRANNSDEVPSSSVYIVGNVIYRIHHPAGSSYSPSDPFALGAGIVSWTQPTVQIVNNSLYDVDAGIAYAGGERSNVRIVNNIVSQLAQASHHIYVGSGSVSGGTAFISNTIMKGPARIKWGGSQPVYNLAAFRNAFPSQCVGCLEADPLYVNPAAGELRLQATSPALNTGIVDPVYATFLSRYGRSISFDAGGLARPQGVAFEMGAFERGSGTFQDVASDYWAFPFVEAIFRANITAGCSTTPMLFCPATLVSRDQMSVFLLRGMRGTAYTPPAAVGLFSDVATTYWAAPWAEEIYRSSVIEACAASPLRFCPTAAISRDIMAVYLLRARHGVTYQPPAATGTLFTDVPITHPYAAWIEQLSREGMTAGCATNLYCPSGTVTRDQMATFLTRAFNLPM